MRAAVFHEIGKPLTIEDVAEPTPQATDLILRVERCGVCGTDVHSATLPPGLPAGTVMGHEFAGEVMEKGSEVGNRFEVGDRVCAVPCIGCGHCASCLNGDSMRCREVQVTGLGQVPGGYAEYVRVGANEVLRLPEGVGFEDGALVEPLAVGLHAVNRAELSRGDSVLVIGAGPIGLATAAWARFFGARVVAVSEKAAGRLALASQFGATHPIDAEREDVGDRLREIAGGPPDVVFECVGVPGLIQQCMGLVRLRGRVIVVGVCMQPDTIMPGLAVFREVRLDFVMAYFTRDFEFALDMLESGRIQATPMITDRIGLDPFPDAFAALTSPSTQCKVMLEPGRR